MYVFVWETYAHFKYKNRYIIEYELFVNIRPQKEI